MSKKKCLVGAENVRWNLNCFYKDIDDPRLDADVQQVCDMIKNFYAVYKGQLSTKLGSALTDYCVIYIMLNKIFSFLFLKTSLDVTDSAVSSKLNDIKTVLGAFQSEYLIFFDFEVVALDDKTINHLIQTDKVVAKHRMMIDKMRRDKPHMLSEEVEAALAKRSVFGPVTWSEFFEVMEANLKIDFRGKRRTIGEMSHLIEIHRNANIRAKALKKLNDELGGIFTDYSAQTLNLIVSNKAVEDKERNYLNPMSVRNKSNDVSDIAVDTLHLAVDIFASPLVKRYYRLKSLLLGVSTLRWSDRNAAIPCLNSKDNILLFDQAFDMVVRAYRIFSPTLSSLISNMMTERRIDALEAPNKHSGAFNYSVIIPGYRPMSFTLMNYRGKSRDMMTLAHELGHAVHGLLAGEAQGPLMAHAPMAFAETASTFGEMLVFNHLKARMADTGDKKKVLKLLMERINETINTTVRQIGFSNFERRLHGAKRWLSAEEIDAISMETTQALYGREGEVFTYENTSHLWSTVSHFHRPFYVYCYAFADLISYGLYAQREVLGPAFEPLYLDFLRAGGSKSTQDLLGPFGLNPEDPDFWARSIKISLEALIVEAEKLCWELGFAIPKSEPLILPPRILIS